MTASNSDTTTHEETAPPQKVTRNAGACAGTSRIWP
jgi:hypothetical protein